MQPTGKAIYPAVDSTQVTTRYNLLVPIQSSLYRTYKMRVRRMRVEIIEGSRHHGCLELFDKEIGD